MPEEKKLETPPTEAKPKKKPYCITNRVISRGDCTDWDTGKTVSTERLYKLEDAIYAAIEKACKWRATNFGEKERHEARPSELLHVLDAFDRHAAYLAATVFVECYEGRQDQRVGGQTFDPDALREAKPGQPLTQETREAIAKHAEQQHLMPSDIDDLQREFQCLTKGERGFNVICVAVYEKATGKKWSSPFRGQGRTSKLAGWSLAGVLRGKADPYKYAMENN